MAHHHVRQGLLIGVLGLHAADVRALAQHRHPVGHVQHLVELVGDDDQGLAVVLHVAHDGKQLVGLLGGQHGGGLVQDQDVGPAVQDLHDLHRLLLGHGHVIDLLIRVNVEAVPVADLLDLLPGLGQVQLPGHAQDDVFRGGEHVHQLEVLVDHADSQGEGVLGGGDGHRLAVDVDLSLVGEIDAGEHIHQGGLAAAVFTQQGQDLTLIQLQRNVLVGRYLAEALGDILHFNCAYVCQGSHPFFPGGRGAGGPSGFLFHRCYFTIILQRCKSLTAKK